MQNIKEAWQNMPGKTRKMILAITAGTLLLAAVGIAVLNLSSDKGYSTLFMGMNSEDAQAVVSMLQTDGIDYRYNDKTGSVQVPAETVDQTRAKLLSAGYPKSGFTYDMYRDNAGIMTTESDKEKYTLYELQDRLGAQIRLFDGVRDAKVTIAEAGEQKYALDDKTETRCVCLGCNHNGKWAGTDGNQGFCGKKSDCQSSARDEFHQCGCV